MHTAVWQPSVVQKIVRKNYKEVATTPPLPFGGQWIRSENPGRRGGTLISSPSNYCLQKIAQGWKNKLFLSRCRQGLWGGGGWSWYKWTWKTAQLSFRVHNYLTRINIRFSFRAFFDPSIFCHAYFRSFVCFNLLPSTWLCVRSFKFPRSSYYAATVALLQCMSLFCTFCMLKNCDVKVRLYVHWNCSVVWTDLYALRCRYISFCHKSPQHHHISG